jgi:hypothetical protein
MFHPKQDTIKNFQMKWLLVTLANMAELKLVHIAGWI